VFVADFNPAMDRSPFKNEFIMLVCNVEALAVFVISLSVTEDGSLKNALFSEVVSTDIMPSVELRIGEEVPCCVVSTDVADVIELVIVGLSAVPLENTSISE